MQLSSHWRAAGTKNERGHPFLSHRGGRTARYPGGPRTARFIERPGFFNPLAAEKDSQGPAQG